MKRQPLITLLSDFGLKDSYVAEMKAIILGICPDALIVDISHSIDKYNVRSGAYILARAAPLFPKGTIHVAVVDPDVGTERRPIIVTTRRSVYVGPDNGLLMLSAQKDKINNVYSITNSKYMRKPVSNTFHGRDIFSPVAAYLAKGVSPSNFGPEIKDPYILSFIHPTITDKKIFGEIIYIDCFGNLITNVTTKHLKMVGIENGTQISVGLKEKSMYIKICSTYGAVEVNAPAIVLGSSGFLELAVNQGNASKIFEVKIGDKIVFKLKQE